MGAGLGVGPSGKPEPAGREERGSSGAWQTGRQGPGLKSAAQPARPLPSTASFSMARRSPRLQCGGRQKPRMLRPVRTRELST